jgi:hypothetical protein
MINIAINDLCKTMPIFNKYPPKSNPITPPQNMNKEYTPISKCQCSTAFDYRRPNPPPLQNALLAETPAPVMHGTCRFCLAAPLPCFVMTITDVKTQVEIEKESQQMQAMRKLQVFIPDIRERYFPQKQTNSK